MPIFSVDISGALEIAFRFINALWAAYAVPLSFTLAFSILGLMWFVFQRVTSYVRRENTDD